MAEPKVEKKTRFDSRDFDLISEYIWEELDRRRKARRDMEKEWEEIDRQLEMRCDNSYKINQKTGKPIPGMEWLPELELPLQAQTLEILVADTHRMMFPETGPWFRAHGLMSDEYLARVDFTSMIAGDENDVPSKINQENIDRLLEGTIGHVHRQGDFRPQWDTFNGEAFKYGTAVGRVRIAKKPSFIEVARGVAREDTLLPVFFARSIKDTYLDDTPHRVMNEGHIIGPAVIHVKKQKLADLVQAAKDGSNDPKDEHGGWMPSKLNGLEPDKTGHVEVIEWEGDLVVPRKTVDNIFVPGAICTVIKTDKGRKVVRMRFRKKPFSSYIAHPYHVEKTNSPYGVGPLMKGRPLQAAASEMFNSLIQAGKLNAEPPTQYSPDDPNFAATGGPRIEPRALWPAVSDIKVHQIGNPAELLRVYMVIVAHYADVTGMHAPRLGQQTVSHTTAFAKEAELSRGQVRTVDYATSVLQGPMQRVLDMQFSYLKETWTEPRNIWIPEYGGFVSIDRAAIPDEAVFEVLGSAGPAERRTQVSEQIQGLQLLAQLEGVKQQLGQGPPLDFTAMQKQIAAKIGFPDVDAFFASAPPDQAAAVEGGPGVPGAAEGNPALATVALQGLQGGGG